MASKKASRRIDTEEAVLIRDALKAATKEVFAALLTPAPPGERGVVAGNITVDEVRAIITKLVDVGRELRDALKD